jgi:hypothetical protein
MADLSEVNLIEDDLIRVTDAPESSNEREHSDGEETQLVVSLLVDSAALSSSFSKLIELYLGGEASGLSADFCRDIALPQAALRRGTARHDEENPESS